MSDTHETHDRGSWTRRGWLSAASAALVGTTIGDATTSASGTAQAPQAPAGAPLPLVEFEPKSMLHVAETTVQRARFPVRFPPQSRGAARPSHQCRRRVLKTMYASTADVVP